MKVTDIKSLTHKAGVYRVAIDNKPLGYLTAVDISNLQLAINKEIDVKDYENIVKQVKYTALYSDALRYSDRRLRSRQEVGRYLISKGSDKQTADKIIGRLVELGIVDEQKLATALIHDSKLSRPMSRKAIELKLKQKHLSQKVIDNELKNSPPTDQQALDLLIKRKASLSAYANNQPKFFRYLLRQGFSYEDIAARIGRPQVY
jgi:regulatory protein